LVTGCCFYDLKYPIINRTTDKIRDIPPTIKGKIIIIVSGKKIIPVNSSNIPHIIKIKKVIKDKPYI
tara:strand:+ start:367 stop:567 length:201 start_codon:yes stop_codon:yes gene_type:complete